MLVFLRREEEDKISKSAGGDVLIISCFKDGKVHWTISVNFTKNEWEIIMLNKLFAYGLLIWVEMFMYSRKCAKND